MHSAGRLAVATAIAFAVASLPVAAQTPPVIDMKGTWKGTYDVIIDGNTTHHPAEAASTAAGKYRLRTQEFTFVFDGQEGRRFWGAVHSGHAKDRAMIGSVSMDGKWIYMAGNVTLIDGTVSDADTIEMCARHATGNAALVGCGVMKRQK